MKTAVIVGSGSEIAQNIGQRLKRDGWYVRGCAHDDVVYANWDLLLLAMGQMKPIGKFFDIFMGEWVEGIEANGMLPLRTLRCMWSFRNKDAHVVFFGGPNMSKSSETYSAYRCGKAILEAIVPTLNAEYSECKFHVLHPGVVATKIHQQTIDAKERAANYAWASQLMQGKIASLDHDVVYGKLKELIA